MDLETKSLVYWSLSRVFHGRDSPKHPPTCQQALKICTEAERELNPYRPLSRAVVNLKFGIIEGKSRKKLEPRDNVLKLRA